MSFIGVLAHAIKKNVKRLPSKKDCFYPLNIKFKKDYNPNPKLLYEFHLFCVVGTTSDSVFHIMLGLQIGR